jgi:hypothetical protein
MKTAIELANILKGTRPYEVYGIRTEDRQFTVGDTGLGCSRDWDHDIDDYSEDYLPGLCATGIGYLWLDGGEDDINAIQEALDYNNGYSGDHQYLIGGDLVDYGEDSSEIVIRNGVILAVIR